MRVTSVACIVAMPAKAQAGVEDEEEEEQVKAALPRQSWSRERCRSGGEGRQIPTIGEHRRSSEELAQWRALPPHLPDFTQPPPGYSPPLAAPLALPLPYPSLAPPYPAPAPPSRQELLQAMVGAQLGEVVQALLATAPAPRRRSLSPRPHTRQEYRRARSSDRNTSEKNEEKDEGKKKKGKITGVKSSPKVLKRSKEKRGLKKRSRIGEGRVEVRNRSSEGRVEVRKISRVRRVEVRSRSREGRLEVRRKSMEGRVEVRKRSREGRVEARSRSREGKDKLRRRIKEVKVEVWSKSKEERVEGRGRKRRAGGEERRAGKVRRERRARGGEEGSRPSKDPGPNSTQVEVLHREGWRGEVGAVAVVRHLIDSDSGLLELRSGPERGAVLFHREQVRGEAAHFREYLPLQFWEPLRGALVGHFIS